MSLDYYDRVNTGLLGLVPETAKHVLDVGCASGKLGATLKERQSCFVTGVEIVEVQAERAVDVLDDVYIGDIYDIAPLLPRAHYDTIVLGDVLEHLTTPGQVLRSLRPLLSDGGQLIVSIPNVGHWSVIKGLLEGRWDYQEAGLLDITHVKFFTRQSFESFLYTCGYQTTLRGVTTVPGECVDGAFITAVKQCDLDTDALENGSNVYQYLYTAQPQITSDDYLTTIVIPVHNCWTQTKTCLESIERNTPEPHEVVVVDNGSTDETWERLQEEEVLALRNEENCSYAIACNQGARRARADSKFTVFLNNDTIVTRGWLGKMLTTFDFHPDVGIVGPMSNYVAGVQKVTNVEYEWSSRPYVAPHTHDLELFAAWWARKHIGKSIPVHAVVGFCFIVRQEVIDSVGLLDEQFVNGFEEYDYCVRAREAGFESRVARDVFIHHSGSQTFIETGVDYWQLIEDNHRRFVEKWPAVLPKMLPAKYASGWLFAVKTPPKVYWAVLFERAMLWEGVDTLLDVSAAAGVLGYTRLAIPYQTVDTVRNQLERTFLTVSHNPDDTLIMLDGDHLFSPDILERLATRSQGVVGALAFRRGAPFDPLFFTRSESDGKLRVPGVWEEGVFYECDAVGTGAIAIKRWVFDRLIEAGHDWPHFRFEYQDWGLNRPGEDMTFALACEKLGIKHYCDTSLEIPHLTMTAITADTWSRYRELHPEILRGGD